MEAISLLLKIFYNIVSFKGEEKYKKIKISNNKFYMTIGKENNGI